MNADTEETVGYWPTQLDFQSTQPKDRTIPHKIPKRLWESVIKRIQGLNADNLIQTCKIIFSEYRLPRKDSIRSRYKLLQVTVHTSCHFIILQPSKQQESRGMHNVPYKDHEKCFETNADIYMTLLWIRSTLNSLGLPSLATFLLNRLTRGILPQFNRQDVVCDIHESNLKRSQAKTLILAKICYSYQQGQL